MAAKLIAPDVSNWPAEDARLVGSKCGDCAAVTWPKQSRCSRCSSANTAESLLPRQGTLVAWTTQGFIPKEPYAGGVTAETFEPFAVGLVQLGDEVRVEVRLTEADPDKLRNGMDLELVFIPFYTEENGHEVLTWAFQPA